MEVDEEPPEAKAAEPAAAEGEAKPESSWWQGCYYEKNAMGQWCRKPSLPDYAPEQQPKKRTASWTDKPPLRIPEEACNVSASIIRFGFGVYFSCICISVKET